ncbi:MAG TPA: hypothetical protein ENH53_13735 [Bacteroidetes bacterium]|nr:hypothetical protein [Bacteroidota bacterium]
MSDDKLGTWASKVLTALANFKETHVKPENYENETARQGGTESFKDPLEFLMYDDAGKYFKQLLDE